MEVLAIIAVTAVVLFVLLLQGGSVRQEFSFSEVSYDTASDLAMHATARFDTAFFDSEEKIMAILDGIKEAENAVYDMPCRNMRKAHFRWLAYRSNWAHRNLRESRKAKRIRDEKRRLGLH
jgi:hypothetical protein